ncbi:matrix-associated actin-dependent regulator [Paramyrothecium foliicola]|nr:matrix-associated actin-dependent regulator [Paramyrothecium foliicola]
MSNSKRTWSDFQQDLAINLSDNWYSTNTPFDFEEPQVGFGVDFNLNIIGNTEPEASAEEVCFGSIVEVTSQLKDRGGPFSFQPQSTLFLEVQPIESFFGLYMLGSLLAVLNKSTCHLLHKLQDSRNIRITGTVQPEQWQAAIGEAQKRTGSVLLILDLNIYGLRQYKQDIGDILGGSGIALQKPSFDLHGTAYDNPHYLELSHTAQDDLLGLSALEIQSTRQYIGATELNNTTTNASEEVDSILNSLSHRTLLHETSVDTRIKSSLLPHQKSAIDYIFKTETGSLPQELSLWDSHADDGEGDYYQHKISGSKAAQPEEAKGGIIADEMGLGKSLVILSAIAGSLNRAAAFAASSRSVDINGSGDEYHGKSPLGATLVVVPSSRNVIFYKHHGNKRKDYAVDLHKANVVFTTYATIATEASRNETILTDIRWFRIVLDEAHDIRNRHTRQFQALDALAAEHRWCLTGTPIHNSLEDLGSLITFLKVPELENASTFNKYISSKVTSLSKSDFQPLRILLSSICLRRTRDLINLPDPVPEVKKLELTELEKQQYKAIVDESTRLIELAHSKRATRKLNIVVLQSLLRLRLFCNNGNLLSEAKRKDNGMPTDPDEILTYLQQREEASCVYCGGNIYTINDSPGADGGLLMKKCLHLVCRGCVPQYQSDKRKCRQCTSRNDESQQDTQLLTILEKPRSTTSLPSHTLYPSKLLAFLKDVQSDVGGFPKHKRGSIAFSSWKKTLDLAGQLLSSHGIKFCCIHGSLSLSNRLKVLQDFRRPLGPDVLLMTMGTGAVGLNLAVATRIYLLEPQWNPSMELQAIGRALRLGQAEHVSIIRYIMKDTVEDSNVLSRQRKKLDLAGGGFSQKRKTMSLEKLETLTEVFGIQLEK